MGHPVAAESSAGRSLNQRRRGHPWPFKVKPMQEPVTEFGVGVPPRQEVIFHDGSAVRLLRVMREGVADLFLRDLDVPFAGVRIDLRRLSPDLATDLPIAQTRDVPGIVHFALRARFKCVDALINEAIALGRPA